TLNMTSFPTRRSSDLEIFVGERFAEHLVVQAEVFDGEPALGNAGGSARLEDIHRQAGQALGRPAAHRTAAQPTVFERREFSQVRSEEHTSELQSRFDL